MYLPPDWSAHTHPEGQQYFYRNSKLRVVTEAHMYRTETMERISYWSKMIEDLLFQMNLVISDEVELFIQLDDDVESCAYYLIDHSSRTEFWIDALPTDVLNLPPVVSNSHLRHALEELYWTHVEHFPMHFGGLRHQVIDELISVFSHGRADRLTSSVSTFHYTAAQCAEFLDLLRSSRAEIMNGTTTCYVARLWSTVASNRFTTHYGQEVSRLSRDQAIIIPSAEKHWATAAATRALCGVPNAYFSRFDKLYVDELVYEDQWKSFMSETLDDWKLSLSWALPLLISTALLLTASTIFSMLSFLTCTASIVSTLVLYLRHENLAQVSAAQASTYLQAVRSRKFDFQLVALAFSLPKALFLWSLGLFTCHVIILAFRLFSASAAIGATVFILGIFLGIRRITSSAEPSTSWGRFPWVCVRREVGEISKV